MIPKIHLLYYKNILDNVMTNFFDEFNDDFKNIDGKYVLCSQTSRNKLKTWLRKHIGDEILKYTRSFSVVSPEYFFIIGSCFPKDNFLLRYIDVENDFSTLKQKLDCQDNIKYTLKEDDIEIEIEKFNFIFEDIFNEMFDHRKLTKILGKEAARNVFMLKHNNLDCYMMYRTVKNIYGKVNVVNIHKNNIDKMKNVMYSINECIDKCIPNKKDIVKRDEMLYIREEIGQYIQYCLKETMNG